MIRRAKHLYDAAKKIVVEHDGNFPSDEKALRRLPGVGPSTAAEIRAFSFGHDVPMIDTNIRRILARVFFRPRSEGTRSEKNTRSNLEELIPKVQPCIFLPRYKELFLFAKSLIPKGRGRAWNYAMLDLGATLCTARNHSSRCPLMKLHGKVGEFRYKKPQKKFAGSNRFYRGRIIKTLTNHSNATPSQLSKELELSLAAVRDVLRGLKRERLVLFLHGRVFLPM